MKRNKVKITYDRDADVLAFNVGGGKLDHAEEMWPFIVHFSKAKKPIYLEIVDASKMIPQIVGAAVHTKAAA
ncbi:MAG: DUF2283 domain-containing protein [Deltaproteobacteria bacterium]|nr:DUF2283 domain-containing protein [Deltaproteobacteria bacterium]